MMGDYLKERYDDKLYTIGFIAHEGSYVDYKFRKKIVPTPPTNSIEYLIGQSSSDNYFLPLKGLSLEGNSSSPLGYQYMTTDIAHVMDGVVFNRYMKRIWIDWELYFKLYPEWSKDEEKKERIVRNYKLSKQKRIENQE